MAEANLNYCTNQEFLHKAWPPSGNLPLKEENQGMFYQPEERNGISAHALAGP